MTSYATKHEVDELREAMTELARQSLRTERTVNRLAEEMIDLKDEMRDLKDEMLAFKNEMREFKNEMLAFKNEMREFKDEMLAFKDEMRLFEGEMRDFKDESVRERKQMSEQWGQLANRLGTLVEDIVAPSLPQVAARLLDCPAPELFAVRVVKRLGGETREYDALVVCPQVILVNETKSRLKASHVDKLLEKLADLPRFCPEYAGRQAVGVLASLYPDAAVIRRATRCGVLVMGLGDEAMQVLNPEALKGERGAAPSEPDGDA